MKCVRCGKEMKRQKIAINRYVFKCSNCGFTIGKQKTESPINETETETENSQ